MINFFKKKIINFGIVIKKKEIKFKKNKEKIILD